MIDVSNLGPERIDSARFEAELLPAFTEAIEMAKLSRCLMDLCGAVVVAPDGEIIGRGFSGPPDGDESVRMCEITATFLPREKKPKSDITCCTHAEVVAIMDAIKNNPDKVRGATVAFARIDKETHQITDAGDPYCTMCSRYAMHVLGGIGKFALFRSGGADVYNLRDFDLLSYAFFEKGTDFAA